MKNLSLNNAYKLLNNKQIISLETDTVPGLVADACSDEALQNIYKIKNRSLNKPLSMMVSDLDMAGKYVFLNSLAVQLLNLEFSVTIVAMAKLPNDLSRYVNLKNQFLALRIPKNEFLLKLICKLGNPVIATSLNISGEDFSDNLVKNTSSPYIRNIKTNNNPSLIINVINKKIIRNNIVNEEKIKMILNNEIR